MQKNFILDVPFKVFIATGLILRVISNDLRMSRKGFTNKIGKNLLFFLDGSTRGAQDSEIAKGSSSSKHRKKIEGQTYIHILLIRNVRK